MKIDQPQTPQPPAAPGQTADPAAAKGTTAGEAAQSDAPVRSPFYNVLTKGKREKSETADVPDLLDKSAIKPDEPGPELGGMKPPKGKHQPEEGKGGKQPELVFRHHTHGPLYGSTTRNPVAEPSGKTPDAPAGRMPSKTDASKRHETPTGEQKTAEPKTTSPAPATAAVTETPFVRGPVDRPAVSEVRATGSADLDRIQALSDEMVEKVQASKDATGNDQVDIQFNSRTLQGLQVNISRNDAGVSIRFNTDSDQISQLLSQNVQALSQALAAKGIDVGDIRVLPNAAAPSESFNSGSGSRQDSRQSGRGSSGGESGGSSGGSSGQGGPRGGR